MENVVIFLILLILPCIAFSLISITYSKYRENKIKSKLCGFDVARVILDNNDLKKLYIVEIKGNLNDHYDYNQKVVRLSSDVYHGDDVTAVSVAARIANYAVMDKNDNSIMKFRFLLNPIITFDIYGSYLLFIIGLCVQDYSMIKLASVLLLIALIFHLCTIPLEYKIAKESSKSLRDLKRLENGELEGCYKVLNLSVYTFIMSILTSLSNLFNEILYNIKKR